MVLGGEAVEVAGCEGGSFIQPTILRTDRTNPIARAEVFGPVLAVLVVDDLEDAVAVANDTEYGLSAAVYTRDINAALWAVDHLDTGIVYVNAPTIGAEIPLPFGGNKHTGNGFREAGTRGIEQFSQVKTVYVDYSGRLQRAQIDNRPGLEEGFVMTLIGATSVELASEAWLARDEAALAATLGAGHGHRGGVEGRARGSSTPTAGAGSTSPRASASPTSVTATRRWSRPLRPSSGG